MSTLDATIKDEQLFKDSVREAGQRICVVHFEAEWAEECAQMNVTLQELAKQHPLAVFLRVDAEQVEDVSIKFEIQCVPTFVVLRDGQLVSRVEGANAAELSKKVHALVSSYVPALAQPSTEHSEKEELNEKLKRLINQTPCVLFMKGSPNQPRCGFSRQILEILNKNNVKFSHFDILTDDPVRQGLKTFANWPTFPQLYSNGELLGGLDIVRELADSGELADQLPKSENLEERLKKLINQAPVMIFMKGNPQGPKCKFSKALMLLFSSLEVEFSSFDILEDNDVREGLKTFSNWPTYPQLYVQGELIGGLDIIKELQESGDLISTLQGSS